MKLAGGFTIYGVSTGLGDSCVNKLSPELAKELPHNLVRYHGCGTGRILGEYEAAAVLAVRLAALGRGYSGVRRVMLEKLCDILNARVLPCIPEEGSVGASGDLTPLSYVAAVLIGEREAMLDGKVMPSAEAMKKAGIETIHLAPKEGLAIMNGTSVMTALGCIAFDRARRLAKMACAITALASAAMGGEAAHFDDRIFALKPHCLLSHCVRVNGPRERPAASGNSLVHQLVVAKDRELKGGLGRRGNRLAVGLVDLERVQHPALGVFQLVVKVGRE